MTLASETMSSILQSPQSSSAVSSKSKLGFSIDSIVGAKNNASVLESTGPGYCDPSRPAAVFKLPVRPGPPPAGVQVGCSVMMPVAVSLWHHQAA